MSPPAAANITLQVPFYDVDMLGIVWHGHYLKYFDLARQEIFNRCGLVFDMGEKRPEYAFPIIRTNIKYIHPLRLNDRFEVHARVTECRVKIVTKFEVRLLPDQILCASGASEQAAIKMPEMEMQFMIPREIQEVLCQARPVTG